MAMRDLRLVDLRLFALAFAGLAASAAADAQELRTGYWASGASAAIGLVLEEGKFLEAEGLKPKWTTVTKLAEVNRALISRSIDIAVVGGRCRACGSEPRVSPPRSSSPT
jgi:ABC-type nitrate/sulfonate/bicarbonate transport system substrate-binding protein